MEHGEKVPEELKKREEQKSKNYHVCLYRDRAEGDGQDNSPCPEESRGGPGQGEGHPSRICDTWYTISPSSQEERVWEAENSRKF